MLSYTTISVLFAFALVVVGASALRHSTTTRTTSVKSLRSVRELLAPKDVALMDQLMARSLPNIRLVRAFNLTNTFVSSDVDVHHRFVTFARKLMEKTTPRGNWRLFAESTTTVMDEIVSSAHNDSIPFDLFIQHLTLKVILHTLFGVPSTDLDDKGVALVAHGINALWKLSKTQQELPEDLLPAMNAHLRAWIPDIENPLDFVIPTFETLWRVVAIAIAMAHKDQPASNAFHELLDNPTKRQFDQFHSDGPSINAIVSEVMRLHPPTKTISRTMASNTPITLCDRIRSFILHPPLPMVHVASIRVVQRDPEIWGHDAEDFNAMRHHPDTLTQEQSAAMLSFGLGKLKCVASSWAPMAVGIISAVVLEQVGDALSIVEGDGIGGREGWDGWSIVLNVKESTVELSPLVSLPIACTCLVILAR